jgi:hypothetical protein
MSLIILHKDIDNKLQISLMNGGTVRNDCKDIAKLEKNNLKYIVNFSSNEKKISKRCHNFSFNSFTFPGNNNFYFII